jgi:hypothetical protein
MPFAALLIGAILIVVAFNNSFGQLATQLESDIPGYFKWAAAIAAILALGYIPGMRTPSRYLLALVLMVIVLANWSQIQAGFTSFASSGGASTGAGAGAANPSAAYTANPATTTTPTASQVAGGSGTTSAGVAASATPQGLVSAATAIASNPLSPSSYLSAFGSSGFGGII